MCPQCLRGPSWRWPQSVQRSDLGHHLKDHRTQATLSRQHPPSLSRCVHKARRVEEHRNGHRGSGSQMRVGPAATSSYLGHLGQAAWAFWVGPRV